VEHFDFSRANIPRGSACRQSVRPVVEYRSR
jgi:hypothetical protein